MSFVKQYTRVISTAFSVSLLIAFYLFFVPCVQAAPDTHHSPKLVNYFLNWELSEAEARALAEWDMVILDMEIQARAPELLQKMRQWNPDIVLLVYITPQEIRADAATSYSIMRRQLAEGITDVWYLKAPSRTPLSWWPGTYLLNVTNRAPLVAGQRWNEYLASFVSSELLSTGYWDGVFYDNSWDNITYFAGQAIDLDLDGVVDTDLDGAWRDGMRTIYTRTRALAGDDVLLVGNNDTTHYLEELNGKMLENFSHDNWVRLMNAARTFARDHRGPQLPIINANTGNSGTQTYQDIRFGLTSSLLENVYFSYDYGDQHHGQTWWYDEYNINLGRPIDDAQSVTGATTYVPDVWHREFDRGIALVNSLNSAQNVDLGGEFEHILGSQDRSVNDGSIVSRVTLSGADGRVLLKPFETLQDVLFTNGDFVRFLRPDGSRVRNGFFVFDERQDGGDQVAHIDLNGDGLRELFVVEGNRIIAWRHDGQPYINPLYPYTANYKGELRVMIGDINNDDRMEIYVAPEAGYAAPIKVYTRYGYPLRQNWFPFGHGYAGGYSLALGAFASGETKQLLVGSGSGIEPRIGIYTWDYQFLNSWLAFEKTFRGGVNIATGDVNGDGIDEVVVGAGPGKGPVIRTFDASGTQIYDEFSASESFSKSGIEVRTQDVDFDGKDDILGMSSEL